MRGDHETNHWLYKRQLTSYQFSTDSKVTGSQLTLNQNNLAPGNSYQTTRLSHILNSPQYSIDSDDSRVTGSLLALDQNNLPSRKISDVGSTFPICKITF